MRRAHVQSRAFALCAASDETTEIRDHVSCGQDDGAALSRMAHLSSHPVRDQGRKGIQHSPVLASAHVFHVS
jgi:hypothetical protein